MMSSLSVKPRYLPIRQPSMPEWARRSTEHAPTPDRNMTFTQLWHSWRVRTRRHSYPQVASKPAVYKMLPTRRPSDERCIRPAHSLSHHDEVAPVTVPLFSCTQRASVSNVAAFTQPTSHTAATTRVPSPPEAVRNQTTTKLLDSVVQDIKNSNPDQPTEGMSNGTTTENLKSNTFVRRQSETSLSSRRSQLRKANALCVDHTNVEDCVRTALRLSPILRRPTRHVTSLKCLNEDGYVKLNQYKLMEEIGQGSYGIVKLAYNEQDKNHYAMKVLDKMKLMKKFACFRKPPPRRSAKTGQSITAHSDPLSQVYREIAILKKLSHPNVVKLVEVLDEPSDNFIYMVFEYLEHGAVLEIPTSEPFSEKKAWNYFRDVLMGLEYLHFQKIVHRDIKPSNLLLSETGQVKIADFGVSSEFEGIDAFLTGTAGTPAFMAPEALMENGNLFYSGRAQDIWSLGITLYSFVIGEVPFCDNYIIALHKKIKTEPVTFPKTSKLSDSLKQLIQLMLKKDPGLRLMLPEIKDHRWVKGVEWGLNIRLPLEPENCQLVTVTEEEIENSVRVIARLDTLILVKAMGHRKRFGNPFRPKHEKDDGTPHLGHSVPAIRAKSSEPCDRRSEQPIDVALQSDLAADSSSITVAIVGGVDTA